MNNTEDILKKILLNMRYDASKTLKENREIIFEESKRWVDVNNNPISFNGTVLKTAREQLKDFNDNYNVTDNEIARDIRSGCFSSISPSSHFLSTGTANWGDNWISAEAKNSKFFKNGAARRTPIPEKARYDSELATFNKVNQEDYSVTGVYQSYRPGWTLNQAGEQFYNRELHDDYTKVINDCISDSIKYLSKRLPKNMPGKIKSNSKTYSTSIFCWVPKNDFDGNHSTCWDHTFYKDYSVNYYSGKEKLVTHRIQELDQITVYGTKNPTINTKTIGNEDKTTTYSSDQSFDYKKEGDKYYFKGKDGTETATKYPTWKQAEGSGLESIKKKIVFTGVTDGSNKGLDIIGDDGIIDIVTDQNNGNELLGGEISLYLSGGGN